MEWDNEGADSLDSARQRVLAPALILVVLSATCGILLCLALAFDLWFLLSGTASRMAHGSSEETAILTRIFLSFFMLAANAAIMMGGLRMKNLRSLSLARCACILALIPCLGPCFILGIPFGVWGLVVLSDPRVREAFETRLQSDREYT